MKINFVILQYNLYEKTIKCVNHILLNTFVDFSITIVDNCSSNNAYKIIRKRYQQEENIEVIKTSENLGFANGNNFGVEHGKNSGTYDWIVVMNNDIYLKTRITQETLCFNQEVVGPDILRLDTNEHQNPLPSINYSKFFILSRTLIYQIYLILNYFHLDYYLHKLAIYVLDKKEKKKISNQQLDFSESKIVDKIHGSVIIFNKTFIDKFPQPFHPSTFMYLEEDFLSLRCSRSGTKILYTPELIFYHDHSSTVDSISKNAHARSRYVYKNNIHSLKAFKKYYNSTEC